MMQNRSAWILGSALGMIVAGAAVALGLSQSEAARKAMSKRARKRELDRRLDEALRATFPTSDAIAQY